MKKLTIILSTLAILFLLNNTAFSYLIMDASLSGTKVTGETVILQVGDSLTLDLLISTNKSLVSGGFEIPYNTSTIDVTNVAPGPSPWLTMTNTWDGGTIDYEAVILPPGTALPPGDDMQFASIELTCLGIGKDALTLSTTSTDDFVDDAGVVLDSEIDNQTLVKISQVPVPAAIWLLGSGLIGLLGFRRSRKI